MQKYDIGVGLPDPNSIQQVSQYIDRLHELEDLVRVMQLKQ